MVRDCVLLLHCFSNNFLRIVSFSPTCIMIPPSNPTKKGDPTDFDARAAADKGAENEGAAWVKKSAMPPPMERLEMDISVNATSRDTVTTCHHTVKCRHMSRRVSTHVTTRDPNHMGHHMSVSRDVALADMSIPRL